MKSVTHICLHAYNIVKTVCRFPQSGAGGAQDSTQGDQAFQEDGDDDLYS